jgi:hypothetical protein
VSGTLDILSAFVFGGMAGTSPGKILRYVASGPFGDGMNEGGTAAAMLGLLTHFTLMAIMVTVYAIAASRIEFLRRYWPVAGVAYGFAIYLVMYWMVVPARFGHYPKATLWGIGNALFSHFFCVGMPMAWIASRMLGRGAAPAPMLVEAAE